MSILRIVFAFVIQRQSYVYSHSMRADEEWCIWNIFYIYYWQYSGSKQTTSHIPQLLQNIIVKMWQFLGKCISYFYNFLFCFVMVFSCIQPFQSQLHCLIKKFVIARLCNTCMIFNRHCHCITQEIPQENKCRKNGYFRGNFAICLSKWVLGVVKIRAWI